MHRSGGLNSDLREPPSQSDGVFDFQEILPDGSEESFYLSSTGSDHIRCGKAEEGKRCVCVCGMKEAVVC